MEKDIDFGFSYHGITYAEEAVLSEDQGNMTARFWEHPTMIREATSFIPVRKSVQSNVIYEKCSRKYLKNIEKEEHEKGR